jgi:hypothetical protein
MQRTVCNSSRDSTRVMADSKPLATGLATVLDEATTWNMSLSTCCRWVRTSGSDLASCVGGAGVGIGTIEKSVYKGAIPFLGLVRARGTSLCARIACFLGCRQPALGRGLTDGCSSNACFTRCLLLLRGHAASGPDAWTRPTPSRQKPMAQQHCAGVHSKQCMQHLHGPLAQVYTGHHSTLPTGRYGRCCRASRLVWVLWTYCLKWRQRACGLSPNSATRRERCADQQCMQTQAPVPTA